MAENGPFFSVVIPTYNRGHTLHIPVQSMLQQTFSDWELIIVDDGSTDDTAQVVQQWPDPRIKYVKQVNQERSVARNTGISKSAGQYICFQDSDDAYLPEHLQILHNAIMNTPESRVYRTGMLYFSNGVQIRKTDFRAARYNSFPFDCLPVWALNRDVFHQHLFDPKLKNGEDLDFILRVCEDKSPLVIKECTGVYNYHPTTSGGVGPDYLMHMQNRILALDKILQSSNKNILPYIVRQRCLCSILILAGQIKNLTTDFIMYIKDCWNVFLRFPKGFIALVFRIMIVKSGEISGLYKPEYRF
jgi:glycosyltransferase involved in cell wall biosynthesis